MKYLAICLILLFAHQSFAQNRLLYETPPQGKARIFLLLDLYHPRQRTIDVTNHNIIINGNPVLKLKTKQYCFIDVEPGMYNLAAQRNGKKLRSGTPVTELEAEAGKIYYFEIEEIWEGGLSIRFNVSRRKARELELIIEERRTRFVSFEKQPGYHSFIIINQLLPTCIIALT